VSRSSLLSLSFSKVENSALTLANATSFFPSLFPDRNVQCAANPSMSHIHKEVWQFSKDLSEHLLPDTSAYAEIWLDKKKVAGDAVQDFEPKYGKYYLPRKVRLRSLFFFFAFSRLWN